MGRPMLREEEVATEGEAPEVEEESPTEVRGRSSRCFQALRRGHPLRAERAGQRWEREDFDVET